MIRYQTVVLDPEADVPLRDIDTWLYRKTITCLEFLISRTDVMNIKTKIVRSVVPIITAHVSFGKIIGYKPLSCKPFACDVIHL